MSETRALTDQKIREMKAAVDAGARWASSLKAGDVFMGAGPAAEARGYGRSTSEYRMFIFEALDVLDATFEGIHTDTNGSLVNLKRRAR